MLHPAAITLLLAASQVQPGVTVTLKPRAVSGDEFVTIADVAVVKGADAGLCARIGRVLLGRAPAEGRVRAVLLGFIRERALQEGFAGENLHVRGAEWVEVKRAQSNAESAGPPLISSGETVTVIIETPHVRITDQGTARSPGRRGEVISVENPRTGRIFTARVEDRETVRVTP